MDTLLLLIYLQLSGIITNLFITCLRDRVENRNAVTDMYKWSTRKKDTAQWLVNYFEEHPQSLLKSRFPHWYKLGQATKRYKEINLLKTKGIISEKEYEGKLEVILPLIDISADLELSSYK